MKMDRLLIATGLLTDELLADKLAGQLRAAVCQSQDLPDLRRKVRLEPKASQAADSEAWRMWHCAGARAPKPPEVTNVPKDSNATNQAENVSQNVSLARQAQTS
jgi:hypothetical protein